MKAYPFIAIVFLSFFCTNAAIGQKDQIRFEHLTKTSGISQSTVYSIVQDKQGFIWIGTADGLNRYDGYTMKKYYHEPDKPNSLGNNRVYNLLVDSEGNLWVATLGGGLNMYRAETDDFIVYKNDKENPQSISEDIVMSLLEDSKGILWVGTADGGLNRFDKAKRIFKKYKHDPTIPTSIAYNTISSIASDRNGCLWLGSNQSGLEMFNPQTDLFIHYKNDPKNPNTISSNNVNHVFVDSRGWIWISTDNGLNILDPVTQKIKRLYASTSDPMALRTNDTHYVLEDQDQNIWVGTYGGISLLKKGSVSTFLFKNYFNDPTDVNSLSNDLIRCIFQDSSGLIWVGNFSNGIDKFNPKLSRFASYRSNPGNKFSLSNNIVRSFNEDKDGYIWIGTFGGGLNRFDPKTEQFKTFNNNPSNKNSLSLNFITSIRIDAEDNIWIGTYGGGLDCYNHQSNKFKHYSNNPDNPKSLSNNYIRAIMFDKTGSLWIATSGGGLNLFNPKSEEFIHFVPDKNDPSSISDARVMGLLEDHEGNIWVGSSSEGLNKLDRSKNKFEHFKNNPDNKRSISSNRVYCIYETQEQHTLWIGTGNGLNRFNRKDSTFTSFTKMDGLPSDVILGIAEDKRGILWISTSNGLCKFDSRVSKNNLLHIYDEGDGLNANEFSEEAYFRDKSGKLYFGGIKGFSVFDPLKMQDNPVKPKTYIIDFQLFNKTVKIDNNSHLKQNITLTKELNLDYSDYVFSFEFAALSYTNPNKNQYRYKLEGFDEEWIKTDANRRFVTYTNLDPGSYTFKVMASNNDGVWNQTATEIKIVILPPYWKTWWFRLLVVAFILACIFFFIRIRTATLKRQKIELERIVDEKTNKVVHQQEELQAYNEELSATNEELYNQREELELTLNSLQSAQKQLVQSEKMASLGVLSAGIAHEINNPLNFIHGGALGIEKYINDNAKEHADKVYPFINAINVGVQRASEIVTSMSRYSRRDDLPQANCDIHSIIDNCLVMLQNQLKAKVEVVKQFTSLPHLIYGNEGKLHQAILNIIANAEQSIEGNGTITITTKVENNFVVATIADSGGGISKEIIDRVFDPFFTTKAPGKGTGLGLSITYNIIQEHKGTISFESIVGQGTTATITFPISKA